MATPIRMAPVLYGKEAEFFFEQWEKMRNTPLQNPITPEEKKSFLKQMKRCKIL
ncbi:MAG: hypothetical protein LBN95_02915 [Prevotellaceae bacterium]|jgi:hypothetical protein|nr:hypothetical protein [Prevotellaceae bacterium]